MKSGGAKNLFFELLGILFVLNPISCSGSGLVKNFQGKAAFDYTAKIVSFGTRVSGSNGSKAAQDYIIKTLNSLGVQTEKQVFTATTPLGKIEMTNLVAKVGKGESDKGKTKIIVVGTHYDTKYMPGITFVGANDGGSGAGVLLVLAGILKNVSLKNSIWLVFFDGEESFHEKSDDDWFYGSRYFVKGLANKGLLASMKSMVLMDMVGDKDFKVNYDKNSTPDLLKKTETIAAALGYKKYFFGKVRCFSTSKTNTYPQ